MEKEKQLLSEIVSGDQSAFAELYQQYYALVRQFVLKFVKSEDQAEDIVQEVFIKIWEGRNNLSAIHSFKAYLLIVSRNHTLNFLKRIAQDEAAVHEMIRHYPKSQNLAEEKLLSKEYRQWIQYMLQTLPVQTRKVLELCRDQDMNYEEAAMVLKISRNAVKKHMVRANKVFKSSFKHLLGISVKLLVMLLTIHY